MTSISRRQFIAAAASLGAAVAFARVHAAPSRTRWTERRDLYPEGVASGDPDSNSVLLWTRRMFDGKTSATLTCEIARDASFEHVIATAVAHVSAESDWTCRTLVGGLEPAHEYWYRFTDDDGNGSRIGRTLTAPREDDTREVRFAFVSCQNANQGAQNAYRRMIFEDEKATPENRLGFVLHLGDFIYELVWYPEDRPQGMYDRKITDIVRYAHGEKFSDFHIPTDVDDYRAIYRAYLRDPDLQDARARFPFVAMWDNHEFSWQGWQSFQKFDGKTRPAQTRKVAAMQAWFEYQPARIHKPNPSLDRFDPPKVVDAPIEHFDEHGMGREPNNLAALASLTGYRALRWGQHVDLIITDQRSYPSKEPFDNDELEKLEWETFPSFFDEGVQKIVDAGKTWNNGHPPEKLRFGDKEIANFTKTWPAKTILGFDQKRWFLDRLKTSRATWKIWGNTIATLDMRADPQNLPAEFTPRWPNKGYAAFGGGDFSSAYVERAEIYDFVAHNRITGFATIAGDRHAFWAGTASKALPPEKFEPVGVAFVTGSISAPGMIESLEHKFPKDIPLRALFLADRDGKPPEPTANMLLRHGVRACLEYAKSRDLAKAKSLSNPDNAPHTSFVDMGGHGYSVVRASASAFEVEFVCIPRPIKRSEGNDGGPLNYRVVHRAALWAAGAKPILEQKVIEGNADLMT